MADNDLKISISANIEQAKAALEQVAAQFQDLSEAAVGSEEELTALQEALNAASEGSAEQVRDSLAAWEQLSESMSDSISAIQGDLDALGETLGDFSAMMSSAFSGQVDSTASLTDNISTAQKAFDGLSASAEAVADGINAIDLGTIADDVGTLGTSAESVDAIFESLTSTSETLASSIALVEEAIINLSTALDELDTDALTEAISQLETGGPEAERNLNAVGEAAVATDTSVAILEQTVDNLATVLDTFSVALAQLIEQMGKFSGQLVAEDALIEKKIELLNAEIESLRNRTAAIEAAGKAEDSWTDKARKFLSVLADAIIILNQGTELWRKWFGEETQATAGTEKHTAAMTKQTTAVQQNTAAVEKNVQALQQQRQEIGLLTKAIEGYGNFILDFKDTYWKSFKEGLNGAIETAKQKFTEASIATKDFFGVLSQEQDAATPRWALLTDAQRQFVQAMVDGNKPLKEFDEEYKKIYGIKPPDNVLRVFSQLRQEVIKTQVEFAKVSGIAGKAFTPFVEEFKQKFGKEAPDFIVKEYTRMMNMVNGDIEKAVAGMKPLESIQARIAKNKLTDPAAIEREVVALDKERKAYEAIAKSIGLTYSELDELLRRQYKVQDSWDKLPDASEDAIKRTLLKIDNLKSGIGDLGFAFETGFSRIGEASTKAAAEFSATWEETAAELARNVEVATAGASAVPETDDTATSAAAMEHRFAATKEGFGELTEAGRKYQEMLDDLSASTEAVAEAEEEQEEVGMSLYRQVIHQTDALKAKAKAASDAGIEIVSYAEDVEDTDEKVSGLSSTMQELATRLGYSKKEMESVADVLKRMREGATVKETELRQVEQVLAEYTKLIQEKIKAVQDYLSSTFAELQKVTKVYFEGVFEEIKEFHGAWSTAFSKGSTDYSVATASFNKFAESLQSRMEGTSEQVRTQIRRMGEEINSAFGHEPKAVVDAMQKHLEQFAEQSIQSMKRFASEAKAAIDRIRSAIEALDDARKKQAEANKEQAAKFAESANDLINQINRRGMTSLEQYQNTLEQIYKRRQEAEKLIAEGGEKNLKRAQELLTQNMQAAQQLSHVQRSAFDELAPALRTELQMRYEHYQLMQQQGKTLNAQQVEELKYIEKLKQQKQTVIQQDTANAQATENIKTDEAARQEALVKLEEEQKRKAEEQKALLEGQLATLTDIETKAKNIVAELSKETKLAIQTDDAKAQLDALFGTVRTVDVALNLTDAENQLNQFFSSARKISVEKVPGSASPQETRVSVDSGVLGAGKATEESAVTAPGKISGIADDNTTGFFSALGDYFDGLTKKASDIFDGIKSVPSPEELSQTISEGVKKAAMQPQAVATETQEKMAAAADTIEKASTTLAAAMRESIGVEVTIIEKGGSVASVKRW